MKKQIKLLITVSFSFLFFFAPPSSQSRLCGVWLLLSMLLFLVLLLLLLLFSSTIKTQYFLFYNKCNLSLVACHSNLSVQIFIGEQPWRWAKPPLKTLYTCMCACMWQQCSFIFFVHNHLFKADFKFNFGFSWLWIILNSTKYQIASCQWLLMLLFLLSLLLWQGHWLHGYKRGDSIEISWTLVYRFQAQWQTT